MKIGADPPPMQLLAVVEQRLGQVAPHFLQIVVARQDVDYFHRWLDENLTVDTFSPLLAHRKGEPLFLGAKRCIDAIGIAPAIDANPAL